MTTEIRLFALKSEKEKVLDRGQNGFQCEDNNYHRGTRLNAMKRFCICSLYDPTYQVNVLTFFSP